MRHIDVHKPHAISAGVWLLLQGYDLATGGGFSIGLPEGRGQIGILERTRPPKGLRALWEYCVVAATLGIVELWKPRRQFATLTVQEDSTSPWLLDVHGIDGMDSMKDLAAKIASAFNVDVRVELKSAESEYEAIGVYGGPVPRNFVSDRRLRQLSGELCGA